MANINIIAPPRYSIALTSAVALAYEILLVRLFSISQWHHFAYMIISLALLGYGMSGAFLALFRQALLDRFKSAFVLNLLLFASLLLSSYTLAQHTAFNSEEILWDPSQWLRLTVSYLLLSLPFFFIANAIGLALMHFHQQVARVYGADLLGAGMGSLGIVALLFLLFPESTLKLLAALGFASAWLATAELKVSSRALRWLPSVFMVFTLLLPTTWFTATLSPYKDLNQILQIGGTRVIARESSPMGLITVVESTQVPLRHAPGMSLMATQEPPEQLALFIDGDGPAAIHKQTDDQQQLAYLDQLTWALPYHLTSPQRVLILGAGGGSEVLQAQYHKVSHIDAVELNPQVTRLISQTYKDYTGGIYNQDRVRLITAEARGFVETTSQHYDLIQVALIDSFSASSAGLFALSENYLYTVEGLQAYLEKLTSDGYLSISRWLKLPPRDSLKLIATAIMSLQQLGIQHPDQHLALIRSWQTSTLIVKRQAFSPQDLENLKSFCQQRGFDVSYYPGIQPEEVNRFNIMADPLPYHAAIALLGSDRDRFLADYKFNLEPATDDRPYFFHFFKWQSLPEIINLFGRGGIPLLDTGYLILVTTLLQAFVISVFLILLPLWFYRRQQQIQLIRAQAGRVFVYFTSLGLAFLFLEIAFIQKLILYLHHPLYAVAVVLTAFLVFAGLGSLVSQHLIHKQASLRWAVTSLILLSLIYLSLLDSIFISMAELEDIFRIAFSILLIAPLAFCMGMPFPVGIHRLEQTQPQLIPWAWGINGCASVISAVLATLLAMHIGFTMVVIIATGLYGIAAFSLPRLE